MKIFGRMNIFDMISDCIKHLRNLLLSKKGKIMIKGINGMWILLKLILIRTNFQEV